MEPESFPVVIYHNPDCGTSRNVLALIRHAGIEPTIVEYLVAPPSRERVMELVRAAGVQLRDVLRAKEPEFTRLGLADPLVPDAVLLDAIARAPVLLQRPFVQTPKGVRLCRPSEVALALLPPIATPFRKEDGEWVAANA